MDTIKTIRNFLYQFSQSSNHVIRNHLVLSDPDFTETQPHLAGSLAVDAALSQSYWHDAPVVLETEAGEVAAKDEVDIVSTLLSTKSKRLSRDSANHLLIDRLEEYYRFHHLIGHKHKNLWNIECIQLTILK